MVNKKGGKGYKKGKKGGKQPPTFEVAEDGQYYAKIIKKLGDRRYSLIVQNSKDESIGRARGSLKGWHNLKSDDIVLISGRDFRQNEKDTFVQNVYDIIGIYLPEHVRKLKKIGEITDPTFNCDDNIGNRDIEFDADDEEECDVLPQRVIEMPSSDEDDDLDIDDL
jgi:translation initiation factor IF-1